MKRAVLYTRVSTDEQADRGYSLSQQIKALEHYCQYNRIEVIHHFEEDFSGENFDRPKWKLLMSMVKAKKNCIDFVLFTKWDRFTRNNIFTYAVIDELQKMGITPNAIEQPLDLTIPESQYLLVMYITQGYVERANIKSRTKKGMMEAKRQGRWCGTPPLGYRYEKSEKTRNKPQLVITSPKAEFVKRAFELYSEGIYSIPEVQIIVTKEFEGKIKYSKQGFINLLSNRVYSGFIKVEKLRPEDDDFVIGIHDPIITDALFQKVSTLLRGRKITKNIRVKGDERFQLRGFLTCTVCGKNITGSAVKKKRFAYYHCQNGHRFKAEEANIKFERKLENIFQLDNALIVAYSNVLRDVFNENNGIVKKTIQNMDRRINEFTDRLDSVKSDYIDGKITGEMYAELKKDINSKINAWVVDRTTLDQNLKTDFEMYLDASLPVLKNLGLYYRTASLQLKRSLLKVLLDGKMTYENGGPCAGKKTALATLSLHLKQIGYRILVVPEAATILMKGGALILSTKISFSNAVKFQISLMRLQM